MAAIVYADVHISYIYIYIEPVIESHSYAWPQS